MDVIPYGGWDRCLRMSAGPVELIATLEVGPRIVRFGPKGGSNLLFENPRTMGTKGGPDYKGYGGHRLWTAPEDTVRTYEADNDPPAVTEVEGGFRLTTVLGPSGLEKSITILANAEQESFTLIHEVTNRGSEPICIAPWAITVMAAGGVCLFPQAPERPHAESLLPARPLVLWSYADMSDPRYTWGRRCVRLRQEAGTEPTKIGAWVEQGYAAYALHGHLFFKRFSGTWGNYPDFGCNFETFTRHDMLEVESLGVLQTLASGETATHTERWYLEIDAEVPEHDQALSEYLERLASSRPGV